MAPINGVMMQYFHSYVAADGNLWHDLKTNAAGLADAGFTAVWLPPAYKGFEGDTDGGYGVYDLFDLGEFDQRGSVRTKYGTRQQYLEAIQTLQQQDVQVYVDVVLSHRIGGDRKEKMTATPFPRDNHHQPTGEPYDIESYTHFTFPGRQGQYSEFEWHWWHFSAVDYNAHDSFESNTVYLLDGKQFEDVTLANGMVSELTGCSVDFHLEEVQKELMHWGEWYLQTTGADGICLDAVRHAPPSFLPTWLAYIQQVTQKELVVIGAAEYSDVEALVASANALSYPISVFDSALHQNFHHASTADGQFDMGSLLKQTLVQQRPTQAITFVENHDSQPLKPMESVVEPWFKPLAYAIILLRQQGYPCVFHADYYGAMYGDRGYDIHMPSHRWLIDKFLYARQHYAHGPQYDYFDHFNTVGWTCLGNADHPKAMAVLMSDGPFGAKWMEVGKPNVKLVDLTEHVSEPVYTNDWGWAEFVCLGRSVSVWVEE